MKKIRFAICVSFAFFFLIATSLPVNAEPPSPGLKIVGKLTFIRGEVDLLKAGWEKAMPARMGIPVSTGDVFNTKGNSRAEITFFDDTVVRLGKDTTLKVATYLFDKKGERKEGILNLLRGKLRSIVSAPLQLIPVALTGGRSGRKFEVHTPTAVVGSRGTDFITIFDEATFTTITTFLTGIGYAFNKVVAGKIVPVNPGTGTTIGPNTPPSDVRPVPISDILQYIDDTSTKDETQVIQNGVAAVRAGEETVEDLLKAAIDNDIPLQYAVAGILVEEAGLLTALVYAAVSSGFDLGIVVEAAIKAGASVEEIASAAGAAGADSGEIENALKDALLGDDPTEEQINEVADVVAGALSDETTEEGGVFGFTAPIEVAGFFPDGTDDVDFGTTPTVGTESTP